MSEAWKKYYEVNSGKPPHRKTVEALDYLSRLRKPSGLSALDFGCGAGRDTRALIDAGMTVTAVDAEEQGVALLRADSIPELTAVCSQFDAFSFGSYDFITSRFALSFNPPETFEAMFGALIGSLNPGGLLACNIFGLKDEWNDGRPMTFMDEKRIKALLGDVEIIELQETDVDGTRADGTPKHWNYYDILAVKK